jgi:hypothetical protein
MGDYSFGAKNWLKARIMTRRPQPFTPIQCFGFRLVETVKTAGNHPKWPGNDDGRLPLKEPPVDR